MTESRLRNVELWDARVRSRTCEDGSVLIWQAEALASWPDRMSDRIAHWASVAPDRTWMAERGPDGAWSGVSYAELMAHCRALGQALLDLELSVDRPLAILSGNSIPHALIALAAQHVGIPSAAIAPAYSLTGGAYEKLTAVRDQITPGAVFADDTTRFAAAMDAVFPGLPRLGVAGAGLDITWDNLRATQPSAAVDAANAATGPETVAKFLFTSGTTGTPKAVITTQRMLCSNQAMVADCYRYFRAEPPVLLDWPPWNHVASGNKVFYMAIYNGGTFHIDAGKPASGAIDQTVRNLRDVSPTWYFNVPVGYEMLVDAMERDASLCRSFFRDLKLMMYAGAQMAEHTWAALDRLALRTTGERVFLTTGLGATETAPMAIFCSDPQDRPGNIGIPCRGVTLKLVPHDDKWEARIKGPSVTPGYWRNPRMTADAFDADGYYMLGDALRFADPNAPEKGLFFDGRVAENFKLATGTWVAVGALRAKLIDALGGLAREVVIAGENRPALGALLIPARGPAERLVAKGDALSDAELFAHPDVRAAIAIRLAAHNAAAAGSSTRIRRALVLTSPLDLDRGELTDKGSVNQRAVLRHRSDTVEALFADHPDVILPAE